MADPIELEELLQKYVSKNKEEVDLMDTYSGASCLALWTALKIGSIGKSKRYSAFLFAQKVITPLKPLYAELFAIIKTTEKLERAYIRDKAHPKEYEEACQRLITQFKTLHDAVRSTVSFSSFVNSYFDHLQTKAKHN
jgi:VPS28 protein